MPSPVAEPLRALGLGEDVRARLAAALARSAPLGLSEVAGPGGAEAARLAEAAVAAAGDPRLLTEALPALLAALAPWERGAGPWLAGVARHLAALAAWRLRGDLPAATEALTASLGLLAAAPGAGAAAYRGRVLDTLGQLLLQQGLLHDAREALERALAVKQAAGDAASAALTQGSLGRLLMALGDFSAARRHLADDLAVVAAAPDASPRVQSQLETELGACALEEDDLRGAGAHLGRALALAERAGDGAGRAFARLHLGRLALREGDPGRAEAHAAAVAAELAALPEGLLPELNGLLSHLRALICRAADDVPGALTHLQQAGRCFARAPRVTPVERAEVLEAHASAAAAAGREAEAADLLREALRVLDATSADAPRRRLEDALRGLNESAWMLHGAGRFVGHGQLAELLAEAGRGGFRGHAEEVTVLFSDLRGFTRLTEALGPERLVEVLNRYFGHMTRCVEAFGGRVDAFIGDAVMAVFPAAPGAAPHAERAARAALYMQADLARFNLFLPPGGGPLRAGIGLHAGPVVAGLIGSPQKRSYTVLGDTVNTASRIEGLTKLLDAPILLSGEVRERLGASAPLALVPLGRWRPLGRQAAVDLYHLAGLHSAPGPAPGPVDGAGRPLAAVAAVADAADAAARALEAFQARRFAEAVQRLEALHGTLPAGAGALARLTRAARQFAAHPPPADWGGDLALEEK